MKKPHQERAALYRALDREHAKAPTTSPVRRPLTKGRKRKAWRLHLAAESRTGAKVGF
jgi:hypothetical protein